MPESHDGVIRINSRGDLKYSREILIRYAKGMVAHGRKGIRYVVEESGSCVGDEALFAVNYLGRAGDFGAKRVCDALMPQADSH